MSQEGAESPFVAKIFNIGIITFDVVRVVLVDTAKRNYVIQIIDIYKFLLLSCNHYSLNHIFLSSFVLVLNTGLVWDYRISKCFEAYYKFTHVALQEPLGIKWTLAPPPTPTTNPLPQPVKF